MDFKEELNHRIDTVNGYLGNYFVNPENAYYKLLFDSMNYSLLNGGKRLRPIILMEMCQLYGSDNKIAKDFACGLEMIHCYSLIHDDLPAMDDDDMRRGKPSNHKVFNEGIAILAGDCLLNSAYQVMIERAMKTEEPEKCLEALQVIASSAGKDGMIVGQVADICNEGQNIEMEDINFINLNKTSALLEAAFNAGAILGGADEQQLEEIKVVGRNIGLSFQIMDDILDVIGDEAELGKPVGSDEKNLKQNYVTVVGLEASINLVNSYLGDSIETLSKFGERSEFMVGLCEFLKNRKY